MMTIDEKFRLRDYIERTLRDEYLEHWELKDFEYLVEMAKVEPVVKDNREWQSWLGMILGLAIIYRAIGK